jgi:hypothetical protein
MNEPDLNLTEAQRQAEIDMIDGACAEADFDLWDKARSNLGYDLDMESDVDVVAEFRRLWAEVE